MTDPHGNTDFFISYRGRQAAWARWINWVVRAAGYSTVLMDEFQVGTTWTSNMRDAARDCRRLIPLYSDDYWASGACVEEFDAYWRHHLQNASARFLLPLEIQKCVMSDMHAMLLAARLYGLNRDEALAEIRKVLKGIAPIAAEATVSGEAEPPFPGVAIHGGGSAGSSSPVAFRRPAGTRGRDDSIG
jgi:TIR domain